MTQKNIWPVDARLVVVEYLLWYPYEIVNVIVIAAQYVASPWSSFDAGIIYHLSHSYSI